MTNENWQGKNIFITGVCGTVGSELLRQLSTFDCGRIVGIDNNETELFFLGQEFENTDNIELFLGDLRDKAAITRLMKGVDIVLHSAALKHVILCERSPRDAVSTNIEGVTNIIDAAEINKVERVIFTSSDKAVNPTNVMGTTKLMGERLMTAANAHRCSESDTIFASTRFGNVLGSRGSVVPIFARQIEKGMPITITDMEMTRFIMTLKESVRLVLESTWLAHGGEVFVTKMPVIRIAELADVMVELLAPRYNFKVEEIIVKIIGVKAGEKMYEELISDEEVRRTLELTKFFVVLPAFKGIYHEINYHYGDTIDNSPKRSYNSDMEVPLTSAELKYYLINNGLIDEYKNFHS
jgi:FlaA1/EpsC-like NDP-sugar epimerase